MDPLYNIAKKKFCTNNEHVYFHDVRFTDIRDYKTFKEEVMDKNFSDIWIKKTSKFHSVDKIELVSDYEGFLMESDENRYFRIDFRVQSNEIAKGTLNIILSEFKKELLKTKFFKGSGPDIDDDRDFDRRDPKPVKPIDSGYSLV